MSEQNKSKKDDPLVWVGRMENGNHSCKGSLTHGKKIYAVGEKVDLPDDVIAGFESKVLEGLVPASEAVPIIKASEIAREVIREESKKLNRKG